MVIRPYSVALPVARTFYRRKPSVATAWDQGVRRDESQLHFQTASSGSLT